LKTFQKTSNSFALALWRQPTYEKDRHQFESRNWCKILKSLLLIILLFGTDIALLDYFSKKMRERSFSKKIFFSRPRKRKFAAQLPQRNFPQFSAAKFSAVFRSEIFRSFPHRRLQPLLSGSSAEKNRFRKSAHSTDTQSQGCQMANFQTKIQIWANLGRTSNGRCCGTYIL
jgi:hypothetical protein